MCLSSRLTRKAQKDAVAKLPEWVTVWKVLYAFAGDKSGTFDSEFRAESYDGGEYAATEIDLRTGGSRRLNYKSGFHSFASRVGAEVWGTIGNLFIVPCKIRPEWITAIGLQEDQLCYVTSKIKIPSPKQYFKTHK